MSSTEHRNALRAICAICHFDWSIRLTSSCYCHRELNWKLKMSISKVLIEMQFHSFTMPKPQGLITENLCANSKCQPQCRVCSNFSAAQCRLSTTILQFHCKCPCVSRWADRIHPNYDLWETVEWNGKFIRVKSHHSTQFNFIQMYLQWKRHFSMSSHMLESHWGDRTPHKDPNRLSCVKFQCRNEYRRAQSVGK